MFSVLFTYSPQHLLYTFWYNKKEYILLLHFKTFFKELKNTSNGGGRLEDYENLLWA